MLIFRVPPHRHDSVNANIYVPAERIGIKQPPLSMQIRQIDRRWARLAFIAERAEAGALLLKGARKRPQGPKKR